MKKGAWLLSFLLVLSLSGCDQTDTTSRGTVPTPTTSPQSLRLKVVVGGKTGWIDTTGKLVINPQYEMAYDFSEGLAGVCVGQCDTEHFMGYRLTKDFKQVKVEQDFKYGFIDQNGKLMINPAFEGARSFSEGLAAVCVGRGCYYSPLENEKKEHKWGFIDKGGAFAISPQFDDAGDFHEGLASVSVGGKWGYIDKDGRFLLNPLYDSALEFEHGFARVGLQPPGENSRIKYGYIDKSGKYVWEPSN